MLPMLAMLIAGYMAKQGGSEPERPVAQASGGLGGGLAGILGGLLAGPGASRGVPGTGAPGLASMFDLNGDGNALDDSLRMAGKAMR